MHGNSRWVSTNQPDINEKLKDVVERHARTQSQKPIVQHTLDAFEQVQTWLSGFDTTTILLDSCCGIGESTWRLAKDNPDALVIGVDKSFSRLEKHAQQPEFSAYDEIHKQERKGSKRQENGPDNTGQEHQAVFHARDNYCVVRADVIDFWRLITQQDWHVAQHTIYYPNPYPKASQLQKRWHGTASLQDILRIGGKLMVRSNWDIYIREFAEALRICGKNADVTQVRQGEPITPFERKYWNSGQQSWQVSCEL